MPKDIEAKVSRWMIANLDRYVDNCNEIDLTRLAEDAAEEFHLYDDDVNFSIPECVFDLAVTVVEELEQCPP